MTAISEEVRRVLQEVDLGAALDDEDLQQIVSSLSGSGSSSSSGFGARSGGSEWAGMSSQSSAGARSEPRGKQGAETPSVRSLTFPDEDRSPARKETPSLRDLGLQPPVAAGSAVASAYGGGRQTAQSRALMVKVQELERELADERHKRYLAESNISRERELVQQEQQDQEEAWKSAQSDWEAQQHRLETALEAARRDTELQRADLTHLAISEGAYNALREQTEADISLREFVQMRVYEHLVSTRRKLEAARKDADAARDALASATESTERDHRSVQHRARVAEQRNETLELELADVRRSEERLREQLQRLRSLVDELEQKGRMFDEVEARRQELQRQTEQDGKRLEEQSATVDELRAEKERLRERSMDLEKQVELLSLDKSHLHRRSQDESAEVRRLSRELEGLQRRLEETERQRDSLQQRFASVYDDARDTAESRLREDFARLREQSNKELELVRIESQEVAARELRLHKESRQAAESECERLRASVERLQRQNAALQESHVTDTHESEMSLAQLRGEFRAAKLQLEQKDERIDELSGHVEELRTESEILREKLDVIRTEHVEMQSNYSRERAELTARLTTEQEKVSAYEALELELDSAIVTAGATAAEQGSATGSGGGDADETHPGTAVTRIASTVPATARRRVRQSIQLAERLVRSQREVQSLQRRLRAMEERHAEDIARIKRLEALVEDSSRPQAYVMARLRERDDALQAAQEEVQRLQKEHVELAMREQEVRAARDALEADLRRVLAQRTEVEDLRALVEDALESSEGGRIRGGRSLPVQGEQRPGSSPPRRSPLAQSPSPNHSGGWLGTDRQPSASVPSYHGGVSDAGADETSPPSFISRGNYNEEGGVGDCPSVTLERSTHDTTGHNVSRNAAPLVRFVRDPLDERGHPLPRWYRRERLAFVS